MKNYKILGLLILIIVVVVAAVIFKTNLVSKKEANITPTPVQISKMVLAYSFVKANQMPLIVAEKKGLFKKYNVEVVKNQVPKNITSVLVAGKADATLGSTNVSLNAAVSGAPLVWVANVNNDQAIVILSNKNKENIRSAGVVSAVNKAQSIGLLTLMGVDVDKITFQELADVPSELLAFRAGQIDMIYVAKPDWINFNNKYKLSESKVILDSSKDKKFQLPISLIVRKEYLDKNPKAVKGVVQALLEANSWIIKNKKEFIKMVQEYFADMPAEDAKIQAEVYYETLSGLEAAPTSPKGKEMLDLVKAANPEAGNYDLNNFISGKIVEELKSEGFFKQFSF